METNCNNDRGKFEFEKIFNKKSVQFRSLYVHAFIYTIGLTIYLLKECYGISFNFFPLQYLNSVVMVIWTSVFLVSVIDLFASYKIFDDEWEEQKMKSLLDKKVKKQKWE
ncbi:2TM domain-containing protein [Flavobacterium zhairuonense]|uniref:2TM domain-containing protein n=1 Tax=Flavobacterium zhairuonense TaxID=2493631 RepID=UPI00104B70F9|nr:2TM domain-containing protein [Flavobacterium zhairuonense]KAF2509340.1 2TM domain-containing protein [Flavobacterium zhairuonense]